jgi:hypothetical protein
MESITHFVTYKLKLKVNESKSAVARPQERKFLGFSFTAGPDVKRIIAPKALERFKRRTREITRRAKGVSIETIMKELASYMRGWVGYFGFCEAPEVLIALHSLGPVATLEPPYTRPVRTVVWEGRHREASPYPDLGPQRTCTVARSQRMVHRNAIFQPQIAEKVSAMIEKSLESRAAEVPRKFVTQTKGMVQDRGMTKSMPFHRVPSRATEACFFAMGPPEVDGTHWADDGRSLQGVSPQ